MEYAGTGKEGPNIAVYRRVNPDQTFRKARPTTIEYGFVVGRLTVATLKVNSLAQYLGRKGDAARRFGPGREGDPGPKGSAGRARGRR